MCTHVKLCWSSWMSRSKMLRPYSSAARELATAAQSLRVVCEFERRSTCKHALSPQPVLRNRLGRPRRVVHRLLHHPHAAQVVVHLAQRLRG